LKNYADKCTGEKSEGPGRKPPNPIPSFDLLKLLDFIGDPNDSNSQGNSKLRAA
jgi:hypothetical protein